MSLPTHRTWGMESDLVEGWQRKSFCRHVDPELMWPLSSGPASDEAARVCIGCPVKLLCLEDGVEQGDWASVRGGLTGSERRRAHARGLAPAEYPPHVWFAPPDPTVPEPVKERFRRCRACQKQFPVDDARPKRRKCHGCATRRRSPLPLAELVAKYRQVRDPRMTRTMTARLLGYASHHGLSLALKRAVEAGLISEAEVVS